MSFQLHKHLDVGTSNPIVARLGIGLPSIVEISKLTAEQKALINRACFATMEALVNAEKAARPLLAEIENAIERLDREGVQTQSGGQVIQPPYISHLDNAKVFLKFAKQALQNVADALGTMLGETFSGPHFHKVLISIEKEFGTEHSITKMLKEDQEWIKKLIYLRNEDEHPASGKQFLTRFNIRIRPEGGYLIVPPMFFDGTQVASLLSIDQHNLLEFSEEIIALTAHEFYPAIVTLAIVPERDRNPDCPVRYLPSPTKELAEQIRRIEESRKFRPTASTRLDLNSSPQ